MKCALRPGSAALAFLALAVIGFTSDDPVKSGLGIS